MSNNHIESTVFKETNSNQRLLVSFAHPDDESFGPAGTLIHYAQKNIAVHYVCATRGEAGSVDPEMLEGHVSLAALRTDELRCAAPILGLTGLHLLDYRDSGMENSEDNNHPDCLIQAPVEEVAEKLVRLIRQIKPQVVVTFDPTGGYFHPDHIHMYKATTMAFYAAGDATRFPHHIEAGLTPYQPQKLYYTAFPRGLVRFFVAVLPLFGQDPTAFGRNKDINLKRIADVKEVVTTRIKVRPYFDLTQQAAACHASQVGGGPGRLPGFIQKWLSRYDSYTRIEPPAHNGSRKENDLFMGLS